MGDEGGRRAPADEADAPHVRLGEAGAGELGPDDGGDASPAEGPVDQRDRGRVGRLAVGDLPAEHVEHLAADQHPVADEAVTGRCHPRGDRRQCGGGGGGDDGGDGPALEGGELAEPGPAGVERQPAEPVEHQEHHRPGPGHGGRQPGRRIRGEQGRYDGGHRGAGVVRADLAV